MYPIGEPTGALTPGLELIICGWEPDKFAVTTQRVTGRSQLEFTVMDAVQPPTSLRSTDTARYTFARTSVVDSVVLRQVSAGEAARLAVSSAVVVTVNLREKVPAGSQVGEGGPVIDIWLYPPTS